MSGKLVRERIRVPLVVMRVWITDLTRQGLLDWSIGRPEVLLAPQMECGCGARQRMVPSGSLFEVAPGVDLREITSVGMLVQVLIITLGSLLVTLMSGNRLILFASIIDRLAAAAADAAAIGDGLIFI